MRFAWRRPRCLPLMSSIPSMRFGVQTASANWCYAFWRCAPHGRKTSKRRKILHDGRPEHNDDKHDHMPKGDDDDHPPEPGLHMLVIVPVASFPNARAQLWATLAGDEANRHAHAKGRL